MNISPEEIKQLLERINFSKADFVKRMQDPNRKYIRNTDGTVSTHELAYVDDGKGNAIVYPEIQNIDGKLVRLKRKDALNSAIQRGDTLQMSTEQAKWFTADNYKNYFENFDKYAEGGTINNIDWAKKWTGSKKYKLININK